MLVTASVTWRYLTAASTFDLTPPTSRHPFRNEGNIMSSYTITITPDDTTRASTTLRVDVSDNAARITELLVRAGAAAGLSPQQLPSVDLDLLLRAVNPGSPASISSAAAQPMSVEPATE